MTRLERLKIRDQKNSTFVMGCVGSFIQLTIAFLSYVQGKEFEAIFYAIVLLAIIQFFNFKLNYLNGLEADDESDS